MAEEKTPREQVAELYAMQQEAHVKHEELIRAISNGIDLQSQEYQQWSEENTARWQRVHDIQISEEE
jgi:hypothetical protein